MAGGLGARFWPFSRNDKPKQFLDFFGTGRSLLQLTYDRFKALVPNENILIVGNLIYRDLILEQLPELKPEQVLLEPARRNTAPCIAYAINRIKATTDKANIIVAPSDHLILREDRFLETIKEGLEFVEKNDSLLTLGIKPSRPETGYGYIQIGEGKKNPHKVKTFTEKPNEELAQVFFETGEFYWNSGIFLWNLQTIQNAFNIYLPEVASKFNAGAGTYNTPQEQDFINDMYPSCPSISIDYGVMEKAESVYVLCADFGWSDLGTWGSLYELSEKDENQNVSLKSETMFYDSEDNIIALPKEKLAVIQDLKGYIVAESDNVLLICKRSDEQRIRQFVNDANFRYDGKYS
jgi:mannose-1-phosphate guanylyltransferase